MTLIQDSWGPRTQWRAGGSPQHKVVSSGLIRACFLGEVVVTEEGGGIEALGLASGNQPGGVTHVLMKIWRCSPGEASRGAWPRLTQKIEVKGKGREAGRRVETQVHAGLALTSLLSSAGSHRPVPSGVAGPGPDGAAGVTGGVVAFSQPSFTHLAPSHGGGAIPGCPGVINQGRAQLPPFQVWSV